MNRRERCWFILARGATPSSARYLPEAWSRKTREPHTSVARALSSRAEPASGGSSCVGMQQSARPCSEDDTVDATEDLQHHGIETGGCGAVLRCVALCTMPLKSRYRLSTSMPFGLGSALQSASVAASRPSGITSI